MTESASLAVHLHHAPKEPHLALLRQALDPAIHLSLGAEPPHPAEYAVLVSGRPTPELLDASPRLEVLVIPFAGVPDITRERLLARPRIRVHNLHHNAAPTAEMALTLLLSAAKLVLPYDRALRSGDWTPRYRESPALLLEDKSALILGYGAIGRRVGRMCLALGMRVRAVRRHPDRTRTDAARGAIDVHGVDELHGLLPEADALVIAVPHAPGTTGLIGAAELMLLPAHAVLVNVSRGPVVDEDALYDALAQGRIHSAGLDVWWRYPEPDARHDSLPASLPFHQLDNVVMSPHRAGHTTLTEPLRMAHLARVLNAGANGGEWPNRVDLEMGY